MDKLKTNRKWQACAVITGIIMLCGVVFLIRFVINFRQAWAENREKVDHWTRSVEWSPDGRQLAAGFDNQCAVIWDANTGEQIRELQNLGGAVRGLNWSADSSALVLGNDGNSGFTFWDPDTGETFTTSPMGDSFGYAAISPDSQQLAVTADGYRVLILDLGTGETVADLNGKHSLFIMGLAWASDSSRIATASADGRVVIWNAKSGQAEQILKAHTGWVNDLDWSPDGKALATAGDDFRVKIWDADSGEILQTLTGHRGAVYGVAWSPDGKQLASSAVDDKVIVWDPGTGKLQKTMRTHEDGAIVVAWSADGAHLAVGIGADAVQIWDAATWELIRTLPSPCIIEDSSTSTRK